MSRALFGESESSASYIGCTTELRNAPPRGDGVPHMNRVRSRAPPKQPYWPARKSVLAFCLVPCHFAHCCEASLLHAYLRTRPRLTACKAFPIADEHEDLPPDHYDGRQSLRQCLSAGVSVRYTKAGTTTGHRSTLRSGELHA